MRTGSQGAEHPDQLEHGLQAAEGPALGRRRHLPLHEGVEGQLARAGADADHGGQQRRRPGTPLEDVELGISSSPATTTAATEPARMYSSRTRPRSRGAIAAPTRLPPTLAARMTPYHHAGGVAPPEGEGHQEDQEADGEAEAADGDRGQLEDAGRQRPVRRAGGPAGRVRADGAAAAGSGRP